MNIEIFGNLLLLYACRYIYKNRIPNPTHPHLSTHPTFSRLSRHPHTTKTLKQAFKHHIHSTTTIYHIYITATPYITTFTCSPQISILTVSIYTITIYYYNPNKNHSERKPEPSSFTINHFLILIINFSLCLVHPVAVILPIQIQAHNK